MNLQCHFGNDAERAFAAEEEHGEIRAGGVARNRKRADDFTGGSDDFQRHDHIFDLAVLRGENAGSAVCEKTADRRARNRSRKVHGGIAFLVALPFQMTRNHAGLTGHGERFLVDADEFVHALHVDDDSAVDGERAALGARSAAPGNDRDVVVVRKFHDAGNFLGAAGMDDEVRLRGLHAAVMPHFRDPVVVDRVTELVGVTGADVLVAENVRKFRANHFVHVAVFRD